MEDENLHHPDRIHDLYQRISTAAQRWPPTTLSHYEGQPFKALIAAMLSAQTREEHTLAAMNALFELTDTPEGILALSDEQITQAIRPVMYYESKRLYLRDICERVLENSGLVPKTVEALTEFKGVGWKVAVLTLATGYGIYDDITVDVHVARISKRLGLVKPETKQPPKINEELKVVLPREMWPYWNGLMVQFGREVCQPTYPQCGRCPVRDLCPQIGVVEIGRGRYKNSEYM